MTSAKTKVWSLRRTPRYLALSLAARAAMEGIVAETNDDGELALAADGLRSVALVLCRPWEEVEPAIQEVLRSGKLVYDRERNVIIDQTQVEALSRPEPPAPSPPPKSGRSVENKVEKGEAIAAELVDQDVAQLKAALERLLEAQPKSAAAIRAKAWRDRKRAEKLAAAVGTSTNVHRDIKPANVRERSSVRANAPNAVPTAPSIETPSIPACSEQRSFAFAEPSPLSLDLNKQIPKTERGGRVVLLRANADGSANITPMPGGWLERAMELRSNLPTSTIHDSWSAFVAEDRKKNASHSSWAVVQLLWEKWLRREHVPTAKPLRKAGPSAAELEARRRRREADEEHKRIAAIPLAERAALALRHMDQIFARAS